jgi:hypothetical protein
VVIARDRDITVHQGFHHPVTRTSVFMLIVSSPGS